MKNTKPIKNWGEEMNRNFLKNETQKALGTFELLLKGS